MDEAGLTNAEAQWRLVQDGPNALPASRPRSLLRLAGNVVGEPMFLLGLGVRSQYCSFN